MGCLTRLRQCRYWCIAAKLRLISWLICVLALRLQLGWQARLEADLVLSWNLGLMLFSRQPLACFTFLRLLWWLTTTSTLFGLAICSNYVWVVDVDTLDIVVDDGLGQVFSWWFLRQFWVDRHVQSSVQFLDEVLRGLTNAWLRRFSFSGLRELNGLL